MHINKIDSGLGKTFKGYNYEKNSVGDTVYRFNYPFDAKEQEGYVEFFRVKKNPAAYAGYEVVQGEPIKRIKIEEGGTPVSLKSDLGLNKDEAFAYRIMVDGQKMKETGINMNGNEYVLVTTNGTQPLVHGAGYLAFPDSQRPGARYTDFESDVPGTVVYDPEIQKDAENTVRTFSNKFGGNLAGLEYDIPILAKNGYKILFACPIAGGDNKSSHHYWNKNNFQIADEMGTLQNFSSFTRKLFQNGMKYVYDGTFTSEGLEGIHFQYALRWAEKNPQSYYWFRMDGLKNGPLGFGVVPKNKENLRHRVINPPVILDETTGKVVKNPNYNSNKETLFQIYDGSQVTEDQVADLDKPIETYKNMKGGNFLKINSHQDTVINYIFEVTPQEYEKSLKNFSDFNKNSEKSVKANSPEGTIQIAQFSNFKLIKKTEGGFVAWDANTDMVKMNYALSNYDEKELQSIPDVNVREYVRTLRQIGAYEVQDMALQAGKYWTGKFKDFQAMYVAQTIKGAKSEEAIRNLVDNGLLPKEALLTQEQVQNVLDGWYNLEQKGVLSKDDVTVKALMKTPLDALELAENTVGILSTSYFSNRATTEETLGKSRFDLMKEENPHLLSEYAPVYLKMNELYNNELKDFAHDVIKKVNETSSEKLLDENGNYTEYGEYVVDLIGGDIARYALLKSLAGDKFEDKVKILPRGEMTYNQKSIKDETTIKSLGLKGVNPKDEAEQLYKKIAKGLTKIGEKDVDFVAQSVSKQIEGTNVNSFRLSEAIVDKAGLGLDWRLDAAKDVIDQDAVRNQETHFDQAWDDVINFWGKFVQIVKSENPHSCLVAEITDVDKLMRASLGDEDAEVWNADAPKNGRKYNSVHDAMMKLFNETGITTEAGYSYFYTNMIKVFGPEFEAGTMTLDPNDRVGSARARIKDLMERLETLTWSRSIDFIRNLFTFVDNHDKPRLLHGFALDMELFHANNEFGRKLGIDYDERGAAKFEANRDLREKCMLTLNGADTVEDLPLEVRLNIDNPEYFRTVSPRAAAMSMLLKQAMNDTIKGNIKDEQMNFLNQALVDLTNGNYLNSSETVNYKTVSIPALSNFENALEEMLNTAQNSYGLNISSDKKAELTKQIIKNANNKELVERHLIHGDTTWGEPNEKVGSTNRERINRILSGRSNSTYGNGVDYQKYDNYAVALTAILRDAVAEDETISSDIKDAIFDAQRDFINKYDAKKVDENRAELPIQETYEHSMMKDGYAARDIETAVKMLIVQAEHRAREAGALGKDETFTNADQILLEVFKAATEPAVEKSVMLLSCLAAIVGSVSIFGGTETMQSGYDEKTKNVFLPRNAVGWEALKEGPLKEYKQEVYKRINDALALRSPEAFLANEELKEKDKYKAELALNSGTPYMLEKPHEDCPAFLQQDAKGNMTVSIFNTTDIQTDNRYDYHAAGIIEGMPANRYVPFAKDREFDYISLGAFGLPVGLTFLNTDLNDKAVYIVKKLADGAKVLVRKDGGKILLNKNTAKNGRMVLKHLTFRGKNLNKQYNVVSNPYQVSVPVEEGKNLSIVSR